MHFSIRAEAKQKTPPEEIQAPPEVVPTRKRKEKNPAPPQEISAHYNPL